MEQAEQGQAWRERKIPLFGAVANLLIVMRDNNDAKNETDNAVLTTLFLRKG